MIKCALIISIICLTGIVSVCGADDTDSPAGVVADASPIHIGMVHSSMEARSLSTSQALSQINANPVPDAASSDMGSDLGEMHEMLDNHTMSVDEMVMQVNANLKVPVKPFFIHFI